MGSLHNYILRPHLLLSISTPIPIIFNNTPVSYSDFSNHDDELHEGESSNTPPYPNSGYLSDTPLALHDFCTSMPTMMRHWFTLKHVELAQQNTPTLPKKTRKCINRDRVVAEKTLHKQYFCLSPERIYEDHHFRRRFRMRKSVFERIVNDVTNKDPYFQQRRDACGVLGFTPIHKCIVALRHLAYDFAYDQLDECLQMGVTTVIETVSHFVQAIINVYYDTYLRKTTRDDIARLMKVAGDRGFPGMLGSIDCMHWEWKNCHMGWRGQFQGRSGRASIILEAVASYDTWIWHAFFGMAGSNNDINVLNKSHLFDSVCEGKSPRVPYDVNQHHYELGYYLTDGIYPKWSAFMPAYTAPNDPDKKFFTLHQESNQKDVEHALGILQVQFSVIRNPARYWHVKTWVTL